MNLPTKPTASSRNTRIGRITLHCTESTICSLQLPCHAAAAPPPPPGSLAELAFEQIEEYLAGKRRVFSLPLSAAGTTPFARAILQAIEAIPYGCTATYGSLGPARAVGHICAGNPLPLLIPCHRVIPANNPPGQYLGGQELKIRLLALEHAFSAPAGQHISCNGLPVMLG